MFRRAATAFCFATGSILLAACGHGDDHHSQTANALPSFVVSSSVTTTAFDGNSDDLLTGGLGKTGLGSATAPSFANAANPTAAELRRLAIWSNYGERAEMMR